MAKTYNMPQVNSKDFAYHIKSFIRMGNYSPVLGLGMAGIGKTELIKQIAKELHIGYKTLRLVDKTETDLLGIPQAVDLLDANGQKIMDTDGHTKSVTKYAPTSLLPDEKRDGEVGILVIDEITSALPNVQAVMYQLLDADRSMGSYTLPPKWKIIMIGNGEDDGGTYQGITPALINRCHACFRIEPDYEAWKVWALNHDIHDTVLAFIKFTPDKLHMMDADEVGVFPSPRSWTLFSNTLKGYEKLAREDGQQLSEFVIDQIASSAVGANVGTEFATFYSYRNAMISPEDIMDGKVGADEISKLSNRETVYITIQSLVSNLKAVIGKYTADDIPKDVFKKIVNALTWAVDIGEVRLDYAVSAIQDMSQIDTVADLVITSDDIDNACPKFLQFVNDNNIIFGN